MARDCVYESVLEGLQEIERGTVEDISREIGLPEVSVVHTLDHLVLDGVVTSGRFGGVTEWWIRDEYQPESPAPTFPLTRGEAAAG